MNLALLILALWVLHNVWYWNNWYETFHPGWIILGVPTLLYGGRALPSMAEPKGATMNVDINIEDDMHARRAGQGVVRRIRLTRSNGDQWILDECAECSVLTSRSERPSVSVECRRRLV